MDFPDYKNNLSAGSNKSVQIQLENTKHNSVEINKKKTT